MPPQDRSAALVALDDLTRRLRAECPWDREQDERSIVPHTLEEAYELADAASSGDDAKLVDELGDVLFQVHFLSLLLEERGAGDLAAVADGTWRKLVRRHPHVFGPESPEARRVAAADAAAHAAPADAPAPQGDADGPGLVDVDSSADVLRNWDAIKRTEPGREGGIFGEVPENLPSLLHARKVQRRAASSGFDPAEVDDLVAAARDELDRLGDAARRGDRPAVFAALGDALFATVGVARRAKADPEIALRSASARFRARVLRAEALALEAGTTWDALDEAGRTSFYARAVLEQSGDEPA